MPNLNAQDKSCFYLFVLSRQATLLIMSMLKSKFLHTKYNDFGFKANRK